MVGYWIRFWRPRRRVDWDWLEARLMDIGYVTEGERTVYFEADKKRDYEQAYDLIESQAEVISASD